MRNSDMESPILITGAARSGTSMVAGAIDICGAFGGRMSGPNKNNKKGMFENYKVRNRIVKPYLKKLGLDRLGQHPLPNPDKIPIPNDWRERVEQIFINQGYEGGPWFYKGAKNCLIWPVWNYAFPNAKWIIVRRNTKDIINSCKKTGFMKRFSNKKIQKEVGADNEEEGWRWWVNQHIKRFEEMIKEGLNCRMIWPEKMVNGDYSEMMDTIEWLGLEWDSEVLSFIDPKLYSVRN